MVRFSLRVKVRVNGWGKHYVKNMSSLRYENECVCGVCDVCSVCVYVCVCVF